MSDDLIAPGREPQERWPLRVPRSQFPLLSTAGQRVALLSMKEQIFQSSVERLPI
jgi:hypothetical protein